MADFTKDDLNPQPARKGEVHLTYGAGGINPQLVAPANADGTGGDVPLGGGVFKAFRLDVAVGHFNQTSGDGNRSIYEWNTVGANGTYLFVDGDPIESILSTADGLYETKSFDAGIEDDVDGTYPGNLLLTFTVPGDRRGRVIVTSDPTWASGVFFSEGVAGMEPHVLVGIRSEMFAAGQTTVTLCLYSTRKAMEADSSGFPAMTGYLTRLFIYVF
ncbi:MAG: hypothetical protein LCH53_11535 [Bacteroidetes bacterium]|nr:hypothetical protein [Bacteroidota bacterium]